MELTWPNSPVWFYHYEFNLFRLNISQLSISYDSDQRTQRKSIRDRDQAHIDCRRNPLRYFHRQEETCQTSAEAAGAQQLRQRVVRMEHRSSVARTSELMHILDPTRQLEFLQAFAPGGPVPILSCPSRL